MEIPVFTFTGFLESGKTTFIMETLQNPEFIKDQKTLLIVTEEGFVEYDSILLGDLNVDVVYVENEEELTPELLRTWHDKYQPDQVLVELNGMWNVTNFLKIDAPEEWINVQVLTTIDSTKFSMYVNNMRSLVYEHVVHSELVIFNRYDESIPTSSLRATIKAINPRAQVIYEKPDGTISNVQSEELPFDKKADFIEVADHDYGLFCMDILEHPEDYKGKSIRIKGKFIGLDRQSETGFILGRKAMVCCEDDTSLIGLICFSPLAQKLIPDEWITIEGNVITQYDETYEGDIPIIDVQKLEMAKPLPDEYVYFN